MGFIYKITNGVNGKVYIGQTIQPLSHRWGCHVFAAAHYNNTERYANVALYRAMNKYGIENFTIEVIEEIDDSLLDEREVYWIDFYHSFGSGYNLTQGGGGAKRFDHDLIKSLWESGFAVIDIASQVGCSAALVQDVLRGDQKCSYDPNESKRRGCRRNSKAVIQYDFDGNYINIFSCPNEVAKHFSVSKSSVTSACNGYTPSLCGYQWRYEGAPAPGRITPQKIPVIQYDLKGTEIARYESLSSAALAVGVVPAAIKHVCDGKTQTSARSLWTYVGSKPNLPTKRCNRGQPVVQKDLDGNVIASYKSAKEASKSTEIGFNSIYNCCTQKTKSAGGFRWEYIP